MKLGKWSKIQLREMWPNEATDFTRWLAQEENLNSLGETIGIELELIESESSVGSFNADIFAKEVGTGRKVIIENQLEQTNHDHLGKIITYAAGKEAQVVVWLVSRAREEHRNAIDWLNEHTDSDTCFFLIEMELWSIDGSNPALRFNIVEQPNTWAKTVKVADSYSNFEKIKLQYWQTYYDVALNDEEFIKMFKPHKPSTDHWTNLAVGSSSYHFDLLIYAKDKIGVEICVPDNKTIGHYFIEHKEEFEEVLGVKGEPYDASKASGVRFYKYDCDIQKHSEKWDEYIRWHMDSVMKMKKVLSSLNVPV